MKIFEQVIAADPRRAYATGYGPATPEAVQAERDALAALAEARAARYPEAGPEAAEPEPAAQPAEAEPAASDGKTPPAETEDVQAAAETEATP